MKVVCAVPFRNSDVVCPWRANSHIDKPALIADYNPETRRGHWSREEPSDLCIPDYWQSCCRHESNRFPPFLDFRRFPPYLHRPACLTSTRLRHCFLKQRQRNLIKRMRVLITRCFVLSTTEKYLSVLEQDRNRKGRSVVDRRSSEKPEHPYSRNKMHSFQNNCKSEYRVVDWNSVCTRRFAWKNSWYQIREIGKNVTMSVTVLNLQKNRYSGIKFPRRWFYAVKITFSQDKTNHWERNS